MAPTSEYTCTFIESLFVAALEILYSRKRIWWDVKCKLTTDLVGLQSSYIGSALLCIMRVRSFSLTRGELFKEFT